MVAALGCANDHSTIDEIDHTTGISHSVGTTRYDTLVSFYFSTRFEHIAMFTKVVM